MSRVIHSFPILYHLCLFGLYLLSWSLWMYEKREKYGKIEWKDANQWFTHTLHTQTLAQNMLNINDSYSRWSFLLLQSNTSNCHKWNSETREKNNTWADNKRSVECKFGIYNSEIIAEPCAQKVEDSAIILRLFTWSRMTNKTDNSNDGDKMGICFLQIDVKLKITVFDVILEVMRVTNFWWPLMNQLSSV